MLKELYGRRYAKNQIALNLLRHINELNKRHDTEEVDVETFAAFVKSHPALLQPAFSMQQTLRERILGGAWWDRRSHERVKVNGMNLRIHDLMKAHLHEGAFHAFMKAVGNCVEIKYQAPHAIDAQSNSLFDFHIGRKERRQGVQEGRGYAQGLLRQLEGHGRGHGHGGPAPGETGNL